MITVSWKQGQQIQQEQNKDFITAITEQIAYEEINGFFSRDLADVYQKMGLNGFKRMKRYQGSKEVKESAKIRNYVVDYMDLIPVYEINYSTPTGLSMLKECVNLDHTLCVENENRLSDLIKIAIKEDKFTVVGILNDFLEKETKRRFKIERLYKECEFVAWDKVYIMQYSKCLHEKFKKKEKEAKTWTEKGY